MQKNTRDSSLAEDEHPSITRVRARLSEPVAPRRELSRTEVRDLAIEAGADDASLVSLDHPRLAEERDHAARALAGAQSLVALVVRMHPPDVRSPSRSVANLEFHRAGEAVDRVAQRVAVALSKHGFTSINPAMAFPMEMDSFPERAWVISHKTVAVAAGLGELGLHRNVIHPDFGSFILLGTVISTLPAREEPPRLQENPCVACKLCVAACPVGAIEPEGGFRFSACYDHNYREFMTGFSDFAEHIAESRNKHELRERVSIAESASLWQSLAYKPNYKAAHCVAVCPAGHDVLGPFVRDRGAFLKETLKPLTERAEPVYVVQGSDAEHHVKRRFPHKPVRVVRSSLRAQSPAAFFRALPLVFQRKPAEGLVASFHFDLSGDEPVAATVIIDQQRVTVYDGLHGKCDVKVCADGRLWLDIVNEGKSAVVSVLTRRLQISGNRKLLARFAACFPR